MKFAYLRHLVVVALLTFPTATILGGWNLVATFQNPVDCGFFFDESHGFVGTGIRSSGTYAATIYATSDGGLTWKQMLTPNGDQGAVTDIYMQTPQVGFASLFGLTQTLWKTTDGGNTWFDFSFAGQNPNYGTGGTCVYATTSGIVVTQWPGASPFGNGLPAGGFASPTGQNFQSVFYGGRSGQSNGVDFTDDLHGVVTMGPQNQGGKINYYTHDGGVTWKSSTFLGESWGVYALKGTTTFFSAGEGDQSSPNPTVYRSNDNGATWQPIYNFLGIQLTGHIAGKSRSVYIQTPTQTNLGLYRSDDLGVTWKRVQGPSNSRDTRFVVTGCAGEVVYAFDQNRHIYKTTDGGDGTLNGSSSGTPLTLQTDTLRIFTSYCSPLTQSLYVGNTSCADAFLDSATTVGDSLSVISTSNANGTTVFAGASDSVVVHYSPAHDGRDTILLVLHGHQGATAINQTVVLAVYNLEAPQPEIGAIASAKVGDTAMIPIYLHLTKDAFSFSSYALHIYANEDVLTPVALATTNTLSQNATSAKFLPFGKDGVVVQVALSSAITDAADLTKPLIYIQAYTTLSDSLETNVTLDSFAINGLSALSLCSLNQQVFQIQRECGDSVISLTMRGDSLLSLLSIIPNPSNGNKVQVKYQLGSQTPFAIDLINSSGVVVATPLSEPNGTSGVHEVEISTEGLASGTYFLVLRSPSGTAAMKMLRIQ
jgi:hypothetical protein